MALPGAVEQFVRYKMVSDLGFEAEALLAPEITGGQQGTGEHILQG